MVRPDRRSLTSRLPAEIAAARLPVVVFGDVLLDTWLAGPCRRLCREAPVPVVDVMSRTDYPGGAGNTATNLAGLGADVQLVGVVGDDHAGRQVRHLLSEAGVRTDGLVTQRGRHTMVKHRLTTDDQLVARFDDGDRDGVTPGTARALADALVAALRSRPAALLIADYGLGTATEETRAQLLRRRQQLPLVVVDAHDLVSWSPVAPDVATPNAAEAAAALGIAVPGGGEARAAAFERHAARLLTATGAGSVVVTLDRDGSMLLAGAGAADAAVHRSWATPAPHTYASGAGDCFTAALTLALAAGLPATAAVELAQAAADVAVRRPGTAVCTSTQLSDQLGRHRAAILSAEELGRVVAEHKAGGRRVVFTNGCFDVLHRGHVGYLNQAKQLGDVLVVAVNSDASVARLKGPDRPVNRAEDRAAVLAALSCVDHVTVFEEDTPIELIRALRPDVYAKGGDYTQQTLPEAGTVIEYGGQVRILDYLPELSTTAIVRRIRDGAAAG